MGEELTQTDENAEPSCSTVVHPNSKTCGTCGSESADEMTAPSVKKRKFSKMTKLNKYCTSWEDIPEFKNWLKKSKMLDRRGHDLAQCQICNCTITAHRNSVFRHSLTEKHKYNSTQVSGSHKIPDMNKNIDTDKRIRRAELKLCSLLATNNLPFILMDTLCPLLGNIFSDSEIAKKLSVRRTKCTQVMKNILGSSFEKELNNILKTRYFSIIMDETTDRSTTKQCAFTVIYYCDIKLKVVTTFFDMVNVQSCTASDLMNCLKNVILKKNIPLQNLVGFCADTTNVMFGEKNSVHTLLKTELPDIVSIKCSCHMAHLAASKACLLLPRSVEDLLRNVGSHFHRSSLRVEKFKEFQMYFRTEIHRILSPANTRWLSVKSCVDRILEQYVPLKEYFRELLFSDPSKTTEEILNTLENRFTQIYIEFMSYVLGLLTDFNILFQSETPLLHKLKPECETLLKTLCSNFVPVKELKDIDIFKFEHKNTDKHIQLENIYLGVAAHESILNLKTDENFKENELQLFLKSCKSFYIEIVTEIEKRFSFNDPIFDVIMIVDPKVAQEYKIKSFLPVFKRFAFLKDIINQQELDKEWRQHALLDYNLYNLDCNSTAEVYWSKIFSLKNDSNVLLFPNLKIVISLLLILPFANASVERVFSSLNNTKTEHRNRLETSTLRAILFAKDGVSSRGGCSNFEPSNEMLNMNIWNDY